MKARTVACWRIWWTTLACQYHAVSSFSSRPAMLPPDRNGHFLSQSQSSRSFQTASTIQVKPALHTPFDKYDHEDASVAKQDERQIHVPRRRTELTRMVLSWLQALQKKLGVLAASLALALLLLLSSPLSSEATMSGGRIGGGSFSSPSSGSGGGSSYSSRSYSSPSYSRSYSSYSSGSLEGYLSRPRVSQSSSVASDEAAEFDLKGFVFWSSLWLVLTYPTMILDGIGSMLVGCWEFFFGWLVISDLGLGISVVQLSVALDVPNRDDKQSMLSVLKGLADTARTDHRKGLSELTSQVALELLQRKSSIVSASSKYRHFQDRTKAEREFQTMAIKERSKFETETVNKYAGVDYSNSMDTSKTPLAESSGGDKSSYSQATVAVVTLVLAIHGDSTKLPRIRSMADVESALQKIASDAKVDDCLQTCEILWTPEHRSETLTLGDVAADYPELRTVS